MNDTRHQPRHHGKFSIVPKHSMSIEEALSLAGNPPQSWTPYFHQEAVRRLYEAGLCLMSQKRPPTATEIKKPMQRVWKARAQKKH